MTSRLLRLSLLSLTATFVSCSADKGKIRGPDIEAMVSGAINLDAEELSPNGCLDLSLLDEKVRGFPPSVMIREYTTGFSMARDALDGQPLLRQRNMAAESAFSALAHTENSSQVFAGSLPIIRQDGCSTIEMEDAMGAKEIHIIDAPSSSIGVLRLKSPDGLRERIYTLKDPRLLEISIMAPKIDRCPDFQKAYAISIYTREWGTRNEMLIRPLRIASGFLRQLSVAVESMPIALYDRISQSSSDYIEPTTKELRSLKMANLDPQIARCPFHARPPVSDEPPPVEEEMIPETQGPIEPPEVVAPRATPTPTPVPSPPAASATPAPVSP